LPSLWSRPAAALEAARTLPDVVDGTYGHGLFQPQVYDWTSHHLETVQLPADLFGAAWAAPVTRQGAMRVPAVARARHLICSALSKMPLQAWRGADLIDPGPYWLQGSNGQRGTVDPTGRGTTEQTRRQLGLWPQSTPERMLWTGDDILFHGRSLWYATYLGADGFPTELLRVPFARWTFDDDGQPVDVDMQPIDPDRVRVILGPHEGLLLNAATTIRQAVDLERNATAIASQPFRLELHQTTDVKLTPGEVSELVAAARAALSDNNGILFTNSAIDTKDHALNSEALMIAARNASALDIARHASMPGAMIDATSAGASLEYQSTVMRNAEWVDLGLTLYSDAIAARLSMDDMVPAGQSVRFDVDVLTSLPLTNPATTD
jgi:hypothetical protein